MFNKVVPLREKTINELGINLDELPCDSQEKVFVQCTKCSEVFLRRWCDINKYHSCPTFINGKKYCSCCNQFLDIEKFSPDKTKSHGLTSWCTACMVKNNYRPDNFLNLSEIATRLECQLIHPDAKLPFQKYTTDAGHDLYSIEDILIPPHKMIDVHTGVKIACPAGWFFTIEGRSSLWKIGIMPCHGIIDATYNGELQVALFNYSSVPHQVKKGDRVAQIILHKTYAFDLVMVDSFGPEYNSRGVHGFGSTGR